MIELAGWAATAVALAGVWLNNRRRRTCFALWLVSNAITFGIHAAAGMWPLAARDGAFFIMGDPRLVAVGARSQVRVSHEMPNKKSYRSPTGWNRRREARLQRRRGAGRQNHPGLPLAWRAEVASCEFGGCRDAAVGHVARAGSAATPPEVNHERAQSAGC